MVERARLTEEELNETLQSLHAANRARSEQEGIFRDMDRELQVEGEMKYLFETSPEDLHSERFDNVVMFSPESVRGLFIIEFRLVEWATGRYTEFVFQASGRRVPGLDPHGVSVSWHDPSKYGLAMDVCHTQVDTGLGPLFYQALRTFGDFKVWQMLEKHFYKVFGEPELSTQKRILEI